MSDGSLVALPNDEKVKVEGIGEVITETHGGVKRRLGDLRYVHKFERNLICNIINFVTSIIQLIILYFQFKIP